METISEATCDSQTPEKVFRQEPEAAEGDSVILSDNDRRHEQSSLSPNFMGYSLML